MKRNLILIVLFILFFALTLVLGNLLIIGEKLGTIHPYIEWGFYLILFLIFAWVTILPIAKIHMAPSLSKLSIPEECDINQLRKICKKLIESCNYINNCKIRKQHKKELTRLYNRYYSDNIELKEVISNELSLRIDGDKDKGVRGINGCIKDWAISSFMVTSISQSSKIDSFSVFIMNIRLISEIVHATGLRPTNAQMMKIYWNIIITSIASYAMSSALNGTVFDVSDSSPNDFTETTASVEDYDISNSTPEDDFIDVDPDVSDVNIDMADASDFGNSIPGMILSKIKGLPISKFFVSSVIDGTTNALLTLRIGYITKLYVIKGADAFVGIKNKRKIRKEAIFEAYRSIPQIIKEGAKSIKHSVVR